MNKRGLSTIVVTVIMVALVLVAVGIVWVVINRIISKGAGNIDLSAKCLDVNVMANAVNCDSANPAICNVTI